MLTYSYDAYKADLATLIDTDKRNSVMLRSNMFADLRKRVIAHTKTYSNFALLETKQAQEVVAYITYLEANSEA